MTHDKNILTNTRDFCINIHFANGGMVKSKYIGNYVGLINNHKIILNDVIYVPSFKRSLISIDHLSKDNYKTVFCKNKYNDKNCAILYNNNGKRIYTSFSNKSKVYKILTSKNNISNSSNNIICYSLQDALNDSDMNLWNRRMGHFNIDSIKDNLNKINIKHKCKICSCSKLKNLPYKPSTNHMTKPFELIHMDLVFVPDYSIYGNKYFLSILDDYSRYSWVLFIKRKSETFKTFIIWYNQIKNLFDNCNIKYIKTDNGTEFFNSNFNEFYERTGIIHEHTIPHNPQ